MKANAITRRTVIQRRAPAFTLIELLVSIGIISVIIGILMPALSQARALSRRTSCTVHLRQIGEAAYFYLQSEKLGFPILNNEPTDGHWQYNYIIWDSRDYRQNFGPFVTMKLFPDIGSLFCPVQSSVYHMQNTFVNPWPPKPNLESRAAYGRRPNVSGLDLTQIRPGTAIYSDLFHTSDYVATGHRKGINVEFVDGHVRWVPAFELLIKNDMGLPTSLIDNETMLKIWKQLDTRE
jgi:prepilin-type N-terminal cleavage/methylation domain-containing protein/prepilin-type processing-associated H-X9-DG protein